MYNISVVIPTYNRAEYINRAVSSVLNQTGQGGDFEISEVVVVDDASDDNTEEILNEIDDARIVYHRLEKNGGANAARNKGIIIATGNWIAFQDSDDEWCDDKIKKQVEYAKEHTDCDMITHPFKAFFSDGTDMTTRIVDSDIMIEELAKRNFIGTPTMLVKKEALDNIGGFDVNMKALQDWDLAVRFASKYRIGMVPEVLLNVNMKVEGISANASRYYESRCRLISKNRDIFIEHGCFDEAVKCLLLHAQKNGLLESVGKMLELYLK